MSESAEKAAEAWQRERYNFSSTAAGDRVNKLAADVAKLAEDLTFEELGTIILRYDDATVGRLVCALLTRYRWQSGSPPKWMTPQGSDTIRTTVLENMELRNLVECLAQLAENIPFDKLGRAFFAGVAYLADTAGRLACALLVRYEWDSTGIPRWMTSHGDAVLQMAMALDAATSVPEAAIPVAIDDTAKMAEKPSTEAPASEVPRAIGKNSHCGWCGARFSAVPWPRTCEHCGQTSYLNPAPVAVLLLPVDDGLLVVRRGIEPKKGQFALPGGFINFGESWQQAAARELHEETGIAVSTGEIADFGTLSAPDGTVLIFGLAQPRKRADLRPTLLSEEVTEITTIAGPVELAFPLHTHAVIEYFMRRNVTREDLHL